MAHAAAGQQANSHPGTCPGTGFTLGTAAPGGLFHRLYFQWVSNVAAWPLLCRVFAGAEND